jgi:hypothetical protein
MDVRKVIFEFILATLPAVLLYFIGWVYLNSYLSGFAINVSELQLDTQTIFIYSFSPFQIIIQRYWIRLGLIALGLTILVIALVWIARKYLSSTRRATLRAKAGQLIGAVAALPPALYGFIGIIAALVFLALLVAPVVRWSAGISVAQRWDGLGARVQPILPSEIKPSMWHQRFYWHENYERCGERRGFEFIFSDQSAYYVLCRSSVDPDTGIIYEVRHNVGLVSVRYVNRR